MLCHGKDQKDVFKGMPLTLNDKTENQINEYLDYIEVTKNVHFIKGDLHQSATTYGKRFRYKSVGSFFGSSEWIHKNFGNTKACCEFDVIDGDIMDMRYHDKKGVIVGLKFKKVRTKLTKNVKFVIQ